LAIIAPSIGVN